MNKLVKLVERFHSHFEKMLTKYCFFNKYGTGHYDSLFFPFFYFQKSQKCTFVDEKKIKCVHSLPDIVINRKSKTRKQRPTTYKELAINIVRSVMTIAIIT